MSAPATATDDPATTDSAAALRDALLVIANDDATDQRVRDWLLALTDETSKDIPKSGATA